MAYDTPLNEPSNLHDDPYDGSSRVMKAVEDGMQRIMSVDEATLDTHQPPRTTRYDLEGRRKLG